MTINRPKIIEALSAAGEELKDTTTKAKEAAAAAKDATAADDLQLMRDLELLSEQAVDLYQQATVLKLRVEMDAPEDGESTNAGNTVAPAQKAP